MTAIHPHDRPPRAMVLAAGFGSRLGDLSTLRPKPLLPVCGATLVRWTVRWLHAQGIREIVVNLHHLGELIEAELGDGSDLGVAIAYTREPDEILGTGGGLRNARPLLDDGRDLPIVVVNAKLLVELSLPEVLAHHLARGAEATMVLRPDPEAERWGALAVGPDGRVCRLLERASAEPHPGPPLMFTGIHVVQPRFLDRIPATGPQCVIRSAYASLFDEGGLHGFVTERYWWEHSTPERYLEGVFNVLEGRVRLPGDPPPPIGVDAGAEIGVGAVLEPPIWVGPGARIGAGARVGPLVQLGAGAEVEPGAEVVRAVVWDGVRVGGRVRDRVVAK